MRGYRSDFQIRVSPLICFWLALSLLLLPLSWAAAWVFCMAIHELGHLLAARWTGVPVYGINLGPGGAKIETGPMTATQELICAMAGPAAGALLILLGKWLPLVALFAFVQTVFNLLPVATMDGRRILRCLGTLLRKTPCKPAQERVQ